MRVKLYHGTRSADVILSQGFLLSKIQPRYINDYAMSALTNPKAVRKYMGPSPAIRILEVTFNGRVATTEEARGLTWSARTPQEYQKIMLAEGIDAVLMGESGVKQFFVYNLKALSGWHVVEEPSLTQRVASQYLLRQAATTPLPESFPPQ